MQRIVRRDAPDTDERPEGAFAFVGLSPRMSGLLRARGICTEAQAQAYLHPSLTQRHDPMLLHDMDKALALLEAARTAGKRFIVYGDYDVDGICATAIIVQTLLQYGLQPPDYPTMYRIPDRHEEGYGLNEDAVRDLAGKADILITVDCGITSVREVAAAKEAGMQVIVTDHHALPDELPPADAVIDPLMPPYPFPGLCGAGVAYQFCRALLGEEAAQSCLDLAALATVADMVPLRDENRAIVYFGLKAIEQTSRPGLRALIRAAGYKPPMRSEHIAFGLAPRMNACGRLRSALMAVSLLFEENEERADQLAFEMNRLNAQRKDEERAVIEDAEEQLKDMDLYRLRTIVINGPGYDSGVVGLAAGRIAEKYGYPTVVLSEGEEFAVGSARSAGGVDIYRALKTCSDLFTRFGGHPQAAGLTLRTCDIPAFRERLSDAVRDQIGADASLMPTYAYDDILDLTEVNESTVSLLERMEPFGMGNPSPVFYHEGVTLWSARAVGQNGDHLKCELMQGDTRRAGIAFRHGGLMKLQPKTVDILFTPVRTEFRGNVTYECQIRKMLPLHVEIARDEAAETADVLRILTDMDGSELQDLSTVLYDERQIAAQGTLVYCCCAETAREWQNAHPELDLHLGPCKDPCAYSAIAYAVSLRDLRAPYRIVILADGIGGPAAKTAFPGAQILCCGISRALSELLDTFFLDRDQLRRLYSVLRKTVPASRLAAAARAADVSLAGAMAGAAVFAQIGLIDFDLNTLEWSMKPLVKRDPEEAPLYRLLQTRKESSACRTPLMNR